MSRGQSAPAVCRCVKDVFFELSGLIDCCAKALVVAARKTSERMPVQFIRIYNSDYQNGTPFLVSDQSVGETNIVHLVKGFE